MFIEPAEYFRGPVLIAAPHMDDEVLACGGTIAKLPDKEQVHVVYATDGMRSPAPIVPWRDAISPDLGETRVNESRAAVALLGLPEQNTHFLRLPEAQLAEHAAALHTKLRKLLSQLRPAHILMPFRYDRHPDHITLNHVLMDLHRAGYAAQATLTEYFVYFRWRLLPNRDLRSYIRPEFLLWVEIHDQAERKRRALDCFRTQTTVYYPWQTRPILTPALLDEVSSSPELFLAHDPLARGADVFRGLTTWIRLVHRVEPSLKKWRYFGGAFLQRILDPEHARAG